MGALRFSEKLGVRAGDWNLITGIYEEGNLLCDSILI